MLSTLKNIFKLVRLQIKQRKPQVLIFTLLLFVYSLIIFSQIDYLETNIISDLSDYTFILIFVFVIAVCLLNVNILSNKELTAYPGTLQTRYISRIIADHLLILCSYFIILFVNIIINFIVSSMIKSSNLSVNTDYLFDTEYILHSFIMYIGISFMGYSIVNLLNTIFTKLHIVSIILIFTFVFILVNSLNLISIGYFKSIIKYYFSLNIGFTTFALRAFLTWIICLALGFCFTFLYKSWSKEMTRDKKSLTLFAIFIFIAIFITSYFSYYDDLENEYLDMYEEMSVATNNTENIREYYVDITELPEEKNNIDFGPNNYLINLEYYDYDYALEWGLIDESFNLPENKAYVKLKASVREINGDDIYKKILDSMSIDFKTNTLTFTENYNSFVVNNFMGNVNKFDKNYNYFADFMTNYNHILNIKVRVIY